MLKLAVIGLGRRSASLLKVFHRVHPGLTLAAVADPDELGARERLKEVGLSGDATAFFPSASRLLEHADEFGGILIGSRCDLHALQASEVAETGLPLFLEKPVAVSYEQITALRDAYRGREKSVVVSFPFRGMPLFAAVLEVVKSGRLGTINQVQATNNVPYGGVYYSRFFREYEISGGLWLQKATHDFDYLNQILGRPIMITAMMSRNVYGGDMPHDLWCSSCDIADTCMESPQGVARRNDDGGVGDEDHPCVFGDRIKNQDAGSALILYDDRTHASYSQNFVSRRSAAQRGATIIGYKATLTFDIFTRAIRVIDHHDDRVDRIEVRAVQGHSGGDEVLVQNFVDVCLGRDESHSDLNAGLLSAAMCLAARESAHRQRWLPIGDVHSDRFPAADAPAFPMPADLEPVA